ncbi:MAG: hypothetical protein AAF558_12475 [Verrucomicrobiota bacterium]
MPFPESWILDKIEECHRADRLAHAYLITGAIAEELETLAYKIAQKVLKSDPDHHSDFHCIRPESKSRRLTVAQIRDIEHELHLKSREGGLKVGLILSADRMCLGQAEAANAFLKTLEEPPEHTLILMTSDRAGELLPTIKSRCISLPLKTEQHPLPSAEETQWISDWINAPGTSVEKAYRRCQTLSEWWRWIREHLEKDFSSSPLEGPVKDAHMESEFLRARDRSMQLLIEAVWERAPNHNYSHDIVDACRRLEELRHALQRNIDQNLSLERCHLLMV